jgi:hypothetical protein
MTIFYMQEKRKAYNLISNNCQNFATNLLEKIKVGGHREFATAFSVWQRAVGKGAIADLFADKPASSLPEDEANPINTEVEMPHLAHQNTVQLAEQVMDENTTKLDNHHSLFHMH